jgi:hypothetical protein
MKVGNADFFLMLSGAGKKFHYKTVIMDEINSNSEKAY